MKFPITHKKQTASFKIVGLMLTIAPLWLMLAAGDTAAYAQTPDRVECPGSWKLVSTSGPQERYYGALAYDSARRQVVLFGGSDLANNRMGDTWTWDGTVWIHSADTGPSPRAIPQMDFDTDQNRVVLFGGTGTPGDPFQDNGDTWEWNGTTWTQVAATGPPARNGGALAYDSRRHLSVLYGGGVTFVGTIFHDTWELLGKDDWKQRFPLAGVTPGNRGLFGLAYDSWRARTVLFGGTDVNDVNLGDTWEWDGIRWKQVASTGPSNRRHSALAYDSARHRVVEFSGADGQTFFGDTWEWNGVDWTQVATTGPSPRAAIGFAYDSARGKAVSFGGLTPQGALLQETWEWTGPIYSCTGRIAGDLNCDSRVDNDDLTILKASLNEAACSISDPRDLNHDGQITAEDAQALVGLCTKLGCKAAAADLFLRIWPSATAVHQGDLLTYAFPVWNLGPDVAEGEVLSNLQVPAGTTFDYVRISGTPGLGTCTHPPFGGTGQIICHEGDGMAPNTTWTVRLTVKVTAPAGTVITENAATMADTPDPNLANNTATVSIKVQ
jgi:Domain of unknown function DUF11